MPNKQHYLSLFQAMQIPTNQAEKAADALSRQDAGELPCPLEGEELKAVRDAHTWWAAKGMPYTPSTQLSTHL
jgi:hypothetical protein